MLTIVGQGAIGLLSACQLQHQNMPVQLWCRHSGKLAVHFTDLQGHTAEHRFSTITAADVNTSKVSANLALTRILIPVKAYAVLPLLAQLQPYLSDQAQLIISHNGMPDLTAYQQQLRAEQGLWFLSTNQAALRTANGVQHTGTGLSTLAAINTAAHQQNASQQQALQQLLAMALGPVALTEDILAVLWQKLAINAVINPVTAIRGCRNGDLAAKELAPLLSDVLQEVCQVAAAEGVDLPFANSLSRLYQVIEATKANQSSMLQDIQQQRPTEIEAITGYLLRCAARHQLTLPWNKALLTQVRQLAQVQG